MMMEEPLIQDPDLDSLVHQVPPELLEQCPDPGTTPAPPEELDTTLKEELPNTINLASSIVSACFTYIN